MFESPETLRARVAAAPLEELVALARRAIRARRHDEAIALLDRRLQAAAPDVEALCLSALARWRANREIPEAAAHLTSARRLSPSDPRVFSLSAEFCLRSGDPRGVKEYAETALALDPDHASALVTLARSDAQSVDDGALDRMRRLAAPASGCSAARRRILWNAIGRVLDARGDIQAAFSAYQASNRLSPARYNREARERRLAEARRVFTADFLGALRRLSPGGGEDCVFIVGMPRSGSSLVERVLLGHPETASCGETDALPDIDAALIRAAGAASYFAHFEAMREDTAHQAAAAYRAVTRHGLRRGAARVVIDKRLGNFLSLPLINLLAPEAAVIHTHRHPLDLCFACFTQDFEGHDYANDLGDLAHYHQIYQEYMSLWSERLGERLLHCRYEDLSADPRAQAQRVVSAAGLEWREDCASPERNRGFVNTASAAQVIEPVHKRRVGRWRAYEPHLAPLIKGLGGWEAIDAAAQRFGG